MKDRVTGFLIHGFMRDDFPKFNEVNNWLESQKNITLKKMFMTPLDEHTAFFWIWYARGEDNK